MNTEEDTFNALRRISYQHLMDEFEREGLAFPTIAEFDAWLTPHGWTFNEYMKEFIKRQ